jgi:hypothetical protein
MVVSSGEERVVIRQCDATAVFVISPRWLTAPDPTIPDLLISSLQISNPSLGIKKRHLVAVKEDITPKFHELSRSSPIKATVRIRFHSI